jgi:spermidine synthase
MGPQACDVHAPHLISRSGSGSGARADDRDAPVVLERTAGVAGGELALRRVGADYEIISNGVFLMDTRIGTSERLLVRGALEHVTRPARLLLGGLGVGFSLAEAVRVPGLAVTVVELEPAVVGWHRTHLRPFSQGALDDPRVSVACADLLDWLPAARERYDAICLDIDNGPDWTVAEGNARLYGADGLALLERRLAPAGTLAVWSAGAAPAYEARLRARFGHVEARPVPAPRGEPDVIYLARR